MLRLSKQPQAAGAFTLHINYMLASDIITDAWLTVSNRLPSNMLTGQGMLLQLPWHLEFVAA